MPELSKINFKEVFNNFPGPIIRCDKKGRIIFFNTAAEKLFEYSVDEVVGENISLIYSSEGDYQTVRNKLDKNKSFYGRVENITKSGRRIICSLSASLLLDENQEIIGSIGFSMDITSQYLVRKELNLILNTATDIIYSLTTCGKFKFINPAVKETLGYNQNKLVGKNPLTLVADKHKEKVKDFFRSLVYSKKEEGYLEFEVYCKDGKTKWIGQKLRPNYEYIKGDKTIVSYYGYVRDIDDLKKSQDSLLESERKYRELFDNSSDLIQSIDAKGNIIYVNQAWKDKLGYENLDNLNYFSVIAPKDLQHCQDIFQDIIKNKRPPEGKVEYSLISTDGEEVIVEGTASITTHNSEVTSIQSFLRDVTYEYKSGQQLKEREFKLRSITETLNDVFYLFNIEKQKYEYVSPNCEIILGQTPELYYAGDNNHKNVLEEDKQLIKNEMKKVYGGESVEFEYRVNINGGQKWIKEKSTPIFDEDGKVIMQSGICSDITDIKKQQQIIYKQNIEIGESINYAKKIQESFLVSENVIELFYSDSFILYKPKDIVSGDFYIVDHVYSNNHDKFNAIIVADCTGHGVPGAVLSIMCNTLIYESFKQNDIENPAQALDFISQKLINLLRSNKHKNMRDGMDISFCIHDPIRNKLNFAAAYNSVILIRNDELIEFRGDNQHVGYSENISPFTNQSIDVKKGDKIILYTDGYKDQFGGEKGKKFLKKRLHELLLLYNDLPMKQLKSILNVEFENWRGEEDQIDDVTIMGIVI